MSGTPKTPLTYTISYKPKKSLWNCAKAGDFYVPQVARNLQDNQGSSRVPRESSYSPQHCLWGISTPTSPLLLCCFEQMCLFIQFKLVWLFFLIKKTRSFPPPPLVKLKAWHISNFFWQRKRQAYESNLICDGLQLEATRSVSVRPFPDVSWLLLLGTSLSLRVLEGHLKHVTPATPQLQAGTGVSQNLHYRIYVCYW